MRRGTPAKQVADFDVFISTTGQQLLVMVYNTRDVNARSTTLVTAVVIAGFANKYFNVVCQLRADGENNQQTVFIGTCTVSLFEKAKFHLIVKKTTSSFNLFE